MFDQGSAHNNILNFTNAISVEAWIYPTGFPDTTTNVNDIVRKGGATYQYILLTTDSGQAYFTFYDGSQWRSSPFSPALATNKWHHLVGLYDFGSCVSIYVDGVEQQDLTPVCGNYTINTGTDDLTFGSGFLSANDFDGYIDEVAIYIGRWFNV